MPSPSNLYAEKVFAEHPLVLWPLDEDAGYISIISEGNRNVETWSISGGFAQSAPDDVSDEPFVDSFVTKVTGDPITSDTGEVIATSPNLINFSLLNDTLGTLSIGAYLYPESPYITAFEIGYEYYDSVTGTNVQNTKYYPVGIYDQWIFISETFEYPKQNTDLRVVIKAIVVQGPDSTLYPFFINGVTVGQWAEEFQSTSLGSLAYSVPENLDLDLQAVLPASAYGFTDNPGYYVIKDTALLAKNTGIPMVYGASNSTALYPNSSGLPSLVIPGENFLTMAGKYQQLTLEFWMKINASGSELFKIVGPIGSPDGIYVEGPFIVIRVGDYSASYFVGEWERPMLIDFRVISDNISLLINGSEVISLDVNTVEIDFPDIENNWIGFYSNDSISTFEIDCVAIYSYQVPAIVAKRRFVYGQGVEFPENINTSYSGTSAFIDYRFADYTNNYNYPENGKWSQGIVNNFDIIDNTLSLPNYNTPTIKISGNKTSADMLADWQGIQNESETFFLLRPSSEWDEINSCLFLDSIRLPNSNVKALYGVFKNTENIVSPSEPLLELYDNSTGNYLKIVNAADSIDYIIRYYGEEQIFYSAQRYYVGEQFSVGFDIDKLSNYFGGNVASFLGRIDSLSLYVGGDKDLSQTYHGKIYKFGFFDSLSISINSDPFAPNGIVSDHQSFLDAGLVAQETPTDAGLYSREFWAYILDGGLPAAFATASLMGSKPCYGVFLNQKFDNYFIDIEAFSYWQDYIPLSYFAQYVSDANGDKYYDLDFIQFNVGYPAPSTYTEEESVSESGWSYGELYNQYSLPTQRTYEALDNELFTGYRDYQDLAERSVKNYKYDTSSSIVKTYISFQYIAAGPNKNMYSFISTESAPKNGIIIPGDNWMTTKYEIVDNMLIYPPPGVDFKDVAIVTHIESFVSGVKDRPLKIRTLQYASQAFNDTTFNPVGTRFGVPIYPFKRSGIYYDFKTVNPFTIYKDSSPYLYLTRNSGIQPRGQYDPLISRGLMIPINQTKASNYKIIAMQAAIRFDEDFFPYAPTQIMEIEGKDSFIKLFMVASDTSGKRAKIYGINAKTGRLEDGIAFYWNGKLVKEPTITIKQWGMLGISFANVVDISNTVGFIRVTAPIIVNNISYYQSTNLQEVQQVTPRSWFSVRQVGATILNWQFWENFYLWNGVLVVSSKSYYGVDPEDIYKTYLGTNKVIVDDTRELLIGGYKYQYVQDTRWQSNTSSPV